MRRNESQPRIAARGPFPAIDRHGRRSADLDALSTEVPGARRMRGLRGHGPDTHRGRGEHHGRPRGRRNQARRGALRSAILTLLAEQPMHGYQVMQELEARSAGRWRPSAGSIYPTLQQLEDERLVSVEELEGRRTYQLTDTGRTAAADQSDVSDWSGERGGGDDLRGLGRELGMAALQVSRVGSPKAVDDARRILTDARRSLYRLLAEDEAG